MGLRTFCFYNEEVNYGTKKFHKAKWVHYRSEN